MRHRFLLLGGLLLMICSGALAQSTAITYQGGLQNQGAAANGPFDFTFALFNAVSTGTQVGVTVTNLDVDVTNGFFTTTMDFGTNTFLGSNRWVEISVRTNGSTGAFSALSPRQLVTPAPFALYALRAGSGLVGPQGPQGTNGVPGTTGQNAATVYGTSVLTLNTTTAELVPGLSESVTVPTNCVVYISADGNLRTSSTASTGYSVVDVFLWIDGAGVSNGGYANLSAANNGGVTGASAHWAFTQAVSLSPGSHTIAVYADLDTGSAATISGGTGGADQGELTVMFLKE